MHEILKSSNLDLDLISLLEAIREYVLAYYDDDIDTEQAHAIHEDAELLVLVYIAKKYRVMHGHDVRKVLHKAHLANSQYSDTPCSNAHIRLSEKLSDNVWRHHRGTPTDIANLYIFMMLAFYPSSREPMAYRGVHADVIQCYSDALLRWHEQREAAAIEGTL